MLKVDSSSELLLQQLLVVYDDTSRYFDQYTLRVRPKLQFCIFGIFPGHFHENTREKWPQIGHDDVFRPPSE